MTQAHAIAKLRKFGTVNLTPGTGIYWASNGRYIVSFIVNGEDRPDQDTVCFHVKSVDEHDEPQSDYFPSSYFGTLTAAIRYAERWTQHDTEQDGGKEYENVSI